MAWPVASTGIDSHAELVKRAKRCIRKFEVKLAEDALDDGAEQNERNDIIRGAFEIAARELTSDRGTFLNTSYRSGQTDSFRAGTAALSKRMADRFANKLLGRGTNQIFLQDELERNRKRKQNQMAVTTPGVKANPEDQSEKKPDGQERSCTIDTPCCLARALVLRRRLSCMRCAATTSWKE